MRHLEIHIAGGVQGVFFRDSAQKKALELGLNGFARNEPDGSVYVEIEGEEKTLRDFINWCHDGPPMARVDKVKIKGRDKLDGFHNFEVV